MKKLLSLLLALALCVTCLSAVAFAVDPPEDAGDLAMYNNACDVTVTTPGKDPVQCKNLYEVAIAIDPSGNSTVTFNADCFSTMTLFLAASCTIDLNGHMLYCDGASGKGGNAIRIETAGTENTLTTVKNGTVITVRKSCLAICTRANGGGLALENVIAASMSSEGSSCAVGVYAADEANNAKHIIKDSTLVSYNNGGFGFMNADADHSKGLYTFENCTIANLKEDGGSAIIGNNGKAGNAVLGENVKLYTYGETPIASWITVTGEAAAAEKADLKVEAAQVDAAGMNVFATKAAEAPVEPTTPAEPVTPPATDTPATDAPATDVPATDVPDVEVPKTGASIAVLGIMATISLAGAVISKKR